MQRVLTIILGLILTTNLLAQEPNSLGRGRIEGVIRSEGKPLEMVTVYLRGTNVHSSTDKEGHYSLEARSGKYVIEIRHVGYETERIRIELKAGERLIHNLSLRLDKRHQLREQVVLGHRRKIEALDKGFPVQVIETQKVATQSIQTSELLERVSGVKVRQEGGLGSHTHYNINGFSGNSIRIFIDGVPAENYGQAFSIASIPPALIERIEVFKGVLPAYLSSDALGGAINIVLKNQRHSSLRTSYSFGSFNTHQWNISGSHRTKRGFLAEGTAFYNYSDNNYKVWGREIEHTLPTGAVVPLKDGARRFHDAYRSIGGRASIGIERKPWADKLSLSATLSSDYKEIQHGNTMRKVYGGRHRRGNTAVLSLSYQKRDLLVDGLDLSLNASHSWIERQIIDTLGLQFRWGGPIYRADGTIAQYQGGLDASGKKIRGAEAGGRWTMGKNLDRSLLLRARLGYRFSERSQLYANYLFNDFARSIEDPLQDPILLALSDTRDLRKSTLTLTYERKDFGDRLSTSLFYKHYNIQAISKEPTINAGTRSIDIKRLSQDISSSGFGLSLAYKLRPYLQLQLSGEKALRMPEPNELFGNATDNLESSTGLKPERSYNLNLGVIFRKSFEGLHHVTANALLLYRDTRGMIRQAITPREDFSKYENLENVLSYGIDAELSYSYDYRFEARLSISKLQALFNTEFDAKGDRYQYYRTHIRNEPSLKINGQVSYTQPNLFTHGGRGQIYLGANFVEAFNRDWNNVGSSNLAIIPAQFLMDAGMSYSFPKQRLTLSLDAKNLLNRQAYDNFGLQKPGFALYAKATLRIL